MRKRTLLALMAVAVFASVYSARVVGQQEEISQPQQGRGPAVTMPDGAGKEAVQATCTKCHGLNMITNYWGDTKQGWETLFGSMVALPPDQKTAISTYLSTHFPVKPAPAAKVIPGPVSISFKEFAAPTLGSRPHDPLAAADGSIWWSGHFAARLGRVDPKSGAIKEFPLSAGAGPHGLVEDKDGNIWYTGIFKHHVGKLDPKTGKVTEYAMPDPKARSPHTPIFDAKGNLWFTLQSGMVGRIVPATGEVKVVPTPTPSANTYPYGIQVNSKGVPWYVDFRGPRLGTVDPNTMAIKEITLPHAESRPRRIALTPDDKVWYTDYTRGYLGVYDPATGQHKEWASPGGPQSEPYGIASIGNILWYSESNVRPNTMVRFDPQTEKFQTWTIPSGGHVVRNMMRTKDGNGIVIAESGINKVALVEIARGNNRTN
jgi:virginiamycin B lyase